MRILLVAATNEELSPFFRTIKEPGGDGPEDVTLFNHHQIHRLVTGVGAIATTYHLCRKLQHSRFDLIINAGIAGGFKPELPPGTVTNVITDRFADLGAELADGSFIDLREMELQPPNAIPFQQGILVNPHDAPSVELLPVNGITVNKVHGNKESIQAIVDKYNPDLESMEGAAFMYVCLLEGVPFLQIRAISNKVEPRDKDKWDIPLAITNLTTALLELIGQWPPERG